MCKKTKEEYVCHSMRGALIGIFDSIIVNAFNTSIHYGKDSNIHSIYIRFKFAVVTDSGSGKVLSVWL